MRDLDLGVLEILIIFFLFLPIIRPYVKSLWYVDGIVLLPLVAFFCTAGVFAAYGFRPECIPLLIYIIIINITNTNALFSYLMHLRGVGFIDKKVIVFFISIFCLGAAAACAVFFLPMRPSTLITENTQNINLADNETGYEYTARIYGSGQDTSEHVLLVVPPVTGGMGVVDALCAALAQEKIVVLSFSRGDIDMPAYTENGKLRFSSFARIPYNWKVLTRGVSYKKENELGRKLEAERRYDIQFLMRYADSRWPNAKKIIAGYGAGGSAAAYLAADSGFCAGHPSLRGVIALESYFYTVFTAEAEPVLETPAQTFAFITQARNYLLLRKPLKIKGLADVCKPALPVLFIASHYNTQNESALWRYAALEKTVRENSGSATLEKLEGIHAFDWTDVPEKYPILRFAAAPFEKNTWLDDECMKNVVSRYLSFIRSTSQNLAEPVLSEDNADAASLKNQGLAEESI
ncbi:MAG: hypothetical protein LBG74_03645 [Spirochaetaceae bacterium]|jgi:hypothetical protein|nr:hypothetical protein [Spirochaetaceae bacterium]